MERARLVLLACSFGIGALSPTTAQDRTPRAADHAATLRPEELRVCEAMARLDWADASERLLDAIGRAGTGARAAMLAECQVHDLAEVATRYANPERLRPRVAALAAGKLAAAHPTLRDALDQLALRWAHDQGDLQACARLRTKLGYLVDWWMIGPFDNERGAGFDTAHPPERGFAQNRPCDGKKRPVTWRRLTTFEPSGRIDLGAMVEPSQQVLAYTATCLHSAVAQNVVLQLGSSQSFQVFLGGTKIAERRVHRDHHVDQDAVLLPLHAGDNLLVLKICTEEGPLEFTARLRDVRGGPAEVEARAEDAALQRAAAAPAAAKPGNPAPSLGARSGLTESGADAYRLGRILLQIGADDYRSPRPRELAETAVRALPDAAFARLLLARSLVMRGPVKAEERDDNPARHALEDLLAKHPEQLQALYTLAAMDLESTRAVDAVLRRVRTGLGSRPGCASLLLLEAKALEAIDLDALALRSLDAAATIDAQGGLLVHARRELAARHLRAGRLEAARACLESLVARCQSPGDAEDLASVLLRAGKRDAAVQLLLGKIRVLPYARGLRVQLARLLAAEGNHAEALKHLREWLTICPEDDGALLMTARFHGELGQVDAQREALRTAVTLNPNRKKERRLLEFLEAEEKPFYHGYEIDSAPVIAADPGPPKDAATAQDPLYYLLDHTVLHAYRNGTTSRYRHFIARILNEAGARQMSRYAVRHWDEQRARLLRVQVHKKDGEVLRPRLHGWAVALPPLGKGDVVDIRYRIDDLAPSFFGDYFGLEHRFSDGNPSRNSRLVLVLDKGRKYRRQSTNGAPHPGIEVDAAGRTILTYAMHDIDRFASETREPSYAETKPLVRVTSYPSWNAFASWWSNLIKTQSQVSPAMRAKVEELTAGLTTTRAKIDAIYKFVTTDVRYKAWEFGVHGYKPYSTPVIFERRHGDCKDKSLLLNAMLSVVGVQAFPVLIHADPLRSSDDLSLPLLSHFNHCISWVAPSQDTPAMFLDGTAVYHPSDTLPDMDYGAKVLVVRSDRGDIQQIGWPPPGDNRTRIDLAIQVLPSGDAEVEYELHATRNSAVWVREHFGNEPAKRKERVERLLKQSFGSVELRDVSISDMLDLAAPVSVRAKFRAKNLLRPQGSGLLLPSGFGIDELSGLAISTERTMPLLLGTPESTAQSIRYTLPTGYAPVELPTPVSLDNEFGTVSARWQVDSGVLRVDRLQSVRLDRVPADRYQAFREFTALADQANRAVVDIQPRPKKAAADKQEGRR
ncbi:MAG: DUF3857 domain-containing protein [Planctomycetes bacterium]|nr:DUF3857 domain-containing protein [Planctomycetota bacterium]